MEHTIPDKSTIIIDTNSNVLSEDVGVFIVNNELLIRRFLERNGSKLLIADNSSFYPIIINESDDFHVVGKIIEVMYRL
jgi:repressor LexA